MLRQLLAVHLKVHGVVINSVVLCSVVDANSDRLRSGVLQPFAVQLNSSDGATRLVWNLDHVRAIFGGLDVGDVYSAEIHQIGPLGIACAKGVSPVDESAVQLLI